MVAGASLACAGGADAAGVEGEESAATPLAGVWDDPSTAAAGRERLRQRESPKMAADVVATMRQTTTTSHHGLISC
ncbi:MAG: hypothetical protein ACK48N_14440, partial [Planctomyces sp.]